MKVYNPALRDAARALDGCARTLDVIAGGDGEVGAKWSRSKKALLLTATQHWKVVELLCELADERTLTAVSEALREPSFRNPRLGRVAFALHACANTRKRR